MFEATWRTMENRTRIFSKPAMADSGRRPHRTDSGNQSVGYDVYDRFDLGSAGNPTLYGTQTGLQKTIAEMHKIGTNVYLDMVWNHNGFSTTATTDGTTTFRRRLKYGLRDPTSELESRESRLQHPRRQRR